ncbi:MAG TPA: MarR family transcriptional regulator [Sphingomonadaceae bacterium]
MVSTPKESRKRSLPAKAEGGRPTGDWRALLQRHARRRWLEVLDCMANGEALPPRDISGIMPLFARLGAQADEVIGIVDHFAVGAALEAFGDGVRDGEPGEEFEAQLDTIVDGLAKLGLKASHEKLAEAERREEAARPRVFQSELWQLLHKTRESAELSYAREIDLVELDRRILFMLRTMGPLVPAGLSAAIGVDKAQVSRSVKRLLELGLVKRSQIRSPVSLTREGEALAQRLMRLAELRNRELSFDVTDEELSEFFGVVEILLDRAVRLYEIEREFAGRIGLSESEAEWRRGLEVRREGEPIAIDRSRIISPLLTLSAYFSRSGALAFKRKTGLSNFEAWVLSEIGYDPPTDWPRLVKALERDHSQAGRTVNHLIEAGLVKREGKPGRRHGRFSPTEKGQRLYDIISDMGVERSEFLMESIPDDRLQIFLATFDKIRRNASAQLDRERAFEELESG